MQPRPTLQPTSQPKAKIHFHLRLPYGSQKGPIFIKALFLVARSGKRRRQKITAGGEKFKKLWMFNASRERTFYLSFTRNIHQNLGSWRCMAGYSPPY
jgi:hypothetical protein